MELDLVEQNQESKDQLTVCLHPKPGIKFINLTIQLTARKII